ncbi:MAG: right-handed parallel beta-helix repeat-containing protein, partial [Candidatus Bathyarchaeota archaeon]|nr:right-handed parallel beta-helix repeat-containing protein [Candidatus Bathyarchaeota archaeon]
IENLTFEDNMQGVLISSTTNSTIRNVTMSQNYYGIFLTSSPRITIHSNSISGNFWGIHATDSPSNRIFHNNFVQSKIRHFYDTASNSAGIWDNGYPIGGNYWDDYVGEDLNRDGIGDSVKKVDARNTDHNPLAGRFHSFDTGLGSEVNVVTNSTIASFRYFVSNNTIRMRVASSTANQTFGFSRVSIPHTIMNDVYEVTIEGVSPLHWNDTLFDNGTHRWIYFTYHHSNLDIVITPEFPALVMLAFLLMATFFVAAIKSRERANS